MEYLQLSLTILCTTLFFLWNYKYLKLYNNEEIIKVSTVDNKAYWVYNNILYTSEVIDGKVSMKKKEKVDSMGMSEDDIHDLLNTIGQK
jgi:hypothetical protein